MNAVRRYHERMIEGAHNYAKADRSDPFALNRALCHIRRGLCKPAKDGRDSFYSAEPFTEMRPSPANDGTEYPVIVYRNIVRV